MKKSTHKHTPRHLAGGDGIDTSGFNAAADFIMNEMDVPKAEKKIKPRNTTKSKVPKNSINVHPIPLAQGGSATLPNGAVTESYSRTGPDVDRMRAHKRSMRRKVLPGLFKKGGEVKEKRVKRGWGGVLEAEKQIPILGDVLSGAQTLLRDDSVDRRNAEAQAKYEDQNYAHDEEAYGNHLQAVQRSQNLAQHRAESRMKFPDSTRGPAAVYHPEGIQHHQDRMTYQKNQRQQQGLNYKEGGGVKASRSKHAAGSVAKRRKREY